jgi:hypothetical protein
MSRDVQGAAHNGGEYMSADEGEARNAGAEAPVPAKPSLLMKIGCPECKNPDPDVIEGMELGLITIPSICDVNVLFCLV